MRNWGFHSKWLPYTYRRGIVLNRSQNTSCPWNKSEEDVRSAYVVRRARRVVRIELFRSYSKDIKYFPTSSRKSRVDKCSDFLRRRYVFCSFGTELN